MKDFEFISLMVEMKFALRVPRYLERSCSSKSSHSRGEHQWHLASCSHLPLEGYGSGSLLRHLPSFVNPKLAAVLLLPHHPLSY